MDSSHIYHQICSGFSHQLLPSVYKHPFKAKSLTVGVQQIFGYKRDFQLRCGGIDSYGQQLSKRKLWLSGLSRTDDFHYHD
jgi:hypothetical protein